MEKQIRCTGGRFSKFIRLCASLALVATMVPAIALQQTHHAYASEPATTSGDFGTNLHWELTDSDTDGTWETLSITNKTQTAEDMPTYKSSSRGPWDNTDARATIKNVVIGDYISSVGAYTFSAYKGIASVKLGKDVKTFGQRVFMNCSNLKEITLNEGSILGNNLFYGCSALESLNWNALTVISASAFQLCTSLKTVDLSTITSIGNNAFANCSGIESIDLSLKPTLGNNVFQLCTSLKTVTGLDQIQTLGTNVFNGCSALESVDLASMTTIPNNTFQNCTRLTTVVGTDNIASIGNYVFDGCTSLSDVSFPAVITVGQYAFQKCTALKTINFPNAKSFNMSAFQSCTSLESIELPSISGSTAINRSAFSGCTSLKSAKLGTENTASATLSHYAFQNCKSLESLDLSGITASAGTPLSGCDALKNITLSKNMTKINGLLKNLKGIEEVIVPDSVTELVNNEFQNCTNLKNVTIGAGVTTIGSQIFTGCTSLEKVNVLDNNTSFTMSNDALYTKDNSTLICVIPYVKGNFVIDSACTTLSNYAFAGCTSLESVNFSNVDMTTVPTGLFSGCTNLKEVDLSAAKSLSFNVFQNCTSLEKVILSEGITEIPSYCFSGCENLKDIQLPKTVTTISMSAFESCKSLTTLDTASVASIGMSAFNGTAIEHLDLSSLSGTINNLMLRGMTNLISLKLGSEAIVVNNSFDAAMRANLESIELTENNTKYGMFDNGQLLCEIDENKNSVKVIMGIGKGKEIVIPETVTTVGEAAFAKNTYIQKVTLPSNGCVLEKDAFGANTSGSAVGCTNLKEFINLDKVTSIGDAAIRGALALEEANLSSVTSIGTKALESDFALKKVVLNPAGASVGEAAFSECKKLEAVDNLSVVTALNKQSFMNCGALKGTIEIPVSITSILQNCFSGCSSIENVVIPEGVTKIESSAFNGCSSLSDLELPATLENVAGGAFAYCDFLDSVNIKGDTEFYYSSPSASSYDPSTFAGTSAKLIQLIAGATKCKLENNSLYNASDKLLLRGESSITTADLIIVDEDVTAGEYAGFSNVTSLVIKGETKKVSVYKNAFKNCKNLKMVVLSNVEFPYNNADVFKGCTSLEKVVLDGPVKNIFGGTQGFGPLFAGCSKFTKFELGENYNTTPDYVKDGAAVSYTVEDGVLYNADKTTVVAVPAGLSEVNLSSSVTKIGTGAFGGNCNMKRFIIPEGVTDVERAAFEETNFEYIKIPSTMWKDKELSSFQKDTAQAGGWFYSKVVGELLGVANTTLKEIDLSSYGQTYIPCYVFAGLGALETVTLPYGVEEIDSGAFYNCMNLKTVYSTSQTLAVAGAGETGDSSLGWTNTTPPAFAYGNGVKYSADWQVNDKISFVGLAYEQNELHAYAKNQAGSFTPYVVFPNTDSATLKSMFGSDQGWDSYNAISVSATDFAKTGKIPSKLSATVKFMDEGFSRTLVQGKDYTIVCLNSVGKAVSDTNTPGTYRLALKGNGTDVIGMKVVATYKQPSSVTITTSLGKYKANNATGTATFTKMSSKAKKAKTISVPATVKANGRTYKVTAIGSKAFYKQTKVTKVTIGNNVKTIGSKAFYGCSKLKTLTLGKATKTISSKAFYKCKKLKTVTVYSKSLTKTSFKNLLKSSKIKTIKCKSYAKKSSVKSKYKKYVKKYKKSVKVK